MIMKTGKPSRLSTPWAQLPKHKKIGTYLLTGFSAVIFAAGLLLNGRLQEIAGAIVSGENCSSIVAQLRETPVFRSTVDRVLVVTLAIASIGGFGGLKRWYFVAPLVLLISGMAELALFLALSFLGIHLKSGVLAGDFHPVIVPIGYLGSATLLAAMLAEFYQRVFGLSITHANWWAVAAWSWGMGSLAIWLARSAFICLL